MGTPAEQVYQEKWTSLEVVIVVAEKPNNRWFSISVACVCAVGGMRVTMYFKHRKITTIAIVNSTTGIRLEVKEMFN